MPDPVEDLRDHLAPIEDLKAAAAVLRWDQETYMPEGGGEARAQQLSTLQSSAHERFVAEKTGELLDRAADTLDDPDPLDPDAALVRATRRDYERAVRVPASLVAELSKAQSQAQQAWTQARANDDFSRFAPHLERLVDLSVEKAEARKPSGYEDELYDALLTEYEPGRTTAEVASLFEALRDDLVPLVDAIASAPQVDDGILRGTYPQARQQEFGRSVIADFGYDFDRGRQDVSAHPFTTSFSPNDVRLTTRYDEDNVASALFSTIHEAGHGLYEQGIDPDLDPFYRAINRVEPSLIRVEADEVTYNLHVMLRFELERGLIDGTVSVNELPTRWNKAMDDYLGVVPETNANGVLQDVHWAQGAFGYFPTYTLGTLTAAQLLEAIEEDIPDLDQQIAEGKFEPLLDWLRTHVHRHGRKLEAPDLLEHTTGEALSPDAWLRYVRDKFGPLYDL
ncbi:MAG: carboxypeptidase M32 [Salinibacter sp.]